MSTKNETHENWTILDHHSGGFGHDWKALEQFLQLLQDGKIPRNSKFALALFQGELSSGKVYKELPIKIAILPNGKAKILHSVNSDILQKEFEKTGTLPLNSKMLELTIIARQIDVPEGLVPEGAVNCKECGKPFEKQGKRLFCSEQCKNRYNQRQWRQRHIKPAE